VITASSGTRDQPPVPWDHSSERLAPSLSGAADHDAEDPAHPTAHQLPSLEGGHLEALLAAHLEGQLFELALPARGIGSCRVDAGVRREVAAAAGAGEHLHGPQIALGHVGRQHPGELEVLTRVRRLGWHLQPELSIEVLLLGLGPRQVLPDRRQVVRDPVRGGRPAQRG
jgi:hypothetical protein